MKQVMFHVGLQEYRRLGMGAGSNVKFGTSGLNAGQLARYIDHTKLTYKPGENPNTAIQQLCTEAKANNFYAVCVRPDKIALAKAVLAGSGVQVATVIGFPQEKTTLAEQKKQITIGNVPSDSKEAEAEEAVKNGADELDLVLNVGQFKEEADAIAKKPPSLRQRYPLNTLCELKNIQQVAGKRPVKVIIETDLLTPEQITLAAKTCAKAGVAMVKTSTGMVTDGVGATVPNVELIRKALARMRAEKKVGIKASGGIKSAEGALALVKAGATRLGTSQGIAIMKGVTVQKGAY